MRIRDFQKNQKFVKLEFLFNKSVENSRESVKNCTISGNLYCLKSYYTGDRTKWIRTKRGPPCKLIPRVLFTLKQIIFVKMIIVCLEFELGKQSWVFRLCGSLNDSDHVYHLQETTALLYPKSFHIVLQWATYTY